MPKVSRGALVAALFVAAFAGPAAAASPTEQVALCAAALDAEGLAPADAYRAKFVKSRGGAVKKVTVRLVPVSGGESVVAECEIRKGEVVAAAVV